MVKRHPLRLGLARLAITCGNTHESVANGERGEYRDLRQIVAGDTAEQERYDWRISLPSGSIRDFERFTEYFTEEPPYLTDSLSDIRLSPLGLYSLTNQLPPVLTKRRSG